MIDISNLAIKPGDIVVFRGKGPGSRFVSFVTRSEWSHVGIAISEETLLHAMYKNKYGRQVDENTLAELLAESLYAKIYIRPETLTNQQKINFRKCADEVKATKLYTRIHAGMTKLPLVVGIISIAFFIWSTILFTMGVWCHQVTLSAGIMVLFFMAGMLWVFCRSFVWSNRSQWGVATTEDFFCNFEWGRRLVKAKYDLFCSKLTLQVDNKIEGPLSTLFVYKNEVTPGDIARACEKLGWASREWFAGN